MSNCIKNLYDYEIYKKSLSENRFAQKLIFTKKNKKNGLISFCKNCMNYYKNDYIKNRIKTNVNVRIIHTTRPRIHHALNGKLKSSSTIDFLGLDFDTNGKWIEFQMTPKTKWKNIDIDHFRPIPFYDISIDEQLKVAFCWKNTRPLLNKVYSQKVRKYNFLDYQLQFITSYQFIKFNDEGINEDFR